MQPEGHHIAEMNLGVLRHDWDDPRVKDFVDGLELVNGVAERSPGFVWRMGDAEMDAAQRDAAGPLGGNPRLASTLSVWKSVAALEHFVWNTVHRAFYARKAEWYDVVETPRLVMWWVPAGHRPCVAEGMERFRVSGAGREQRPGIRLVASGTGEAVARAEMRGRGGGVG